MRSPPTEKRLPSFLLPFWRPWVLISFGVHGILLFAPLLPESKPTLADAEPIRVTELTPSVGPTPTSKVSPSVKASPVIPTLQIPPSPQTIQPEPVPPPVPPTAPQSTPVSLPVASPSPSPSPSPTPSLTPSPTPTPISTPSPSPTPSLLPSPIVTPISTPTDPFANFPHPTGVSGCESLAQCWQTSDTQWRAIANHVKQNLRDQGYMLEEIPLADDTGREVFRVSKSGEAPYYLSFISTTTQGTVYRLTAQPLTDQEMVDIARQ